MKFALVYRKNEPYPIRHVIKTNEINKENFLKNYYTTFCSYPDDTVEYYDTWDEVYARERFLAQQMKLNH